MNTPLPGALAAPQPAPKAPPVRFNSQELFQKARSVQIEHDGKIYELRVTRLNKLILTA